MVEYLDSLSANVTVLEVRLLVDEGFIVDESILRKDPFLSIGRKELAL